MPDFRANVTSGFDQLDERYRQLSDDLPSPNDKEASPSQDQEIQKATYPLLKQFGDEFIETSLIDIAKEHRMLHLQKDQIFEELHELQRLFTLLVETDGSHNPEFILQISIVWNHVLDHASFVKMIDLHKVIDTQLLHELIANIEHYPEDGDFSLSYYMMHFPGEQWHPFPLMKIFQYLHQEASNQYPFSKLKEWIACLEKIIPSHCSPDVYVEEQIDHSSPSN